MIKNKIRIPKSLKPLAEEAKKYGSEKEFVDNVYGNTWPYIHKDVRIMEKFTGQGYGMRMYQKPTIDALKDFYKIVIKGVKCEDL